MTRFERSEDDDDEITLTQCLACGGNYKIVSEHSVGNYTVSQCRWCVYGGMSNSQKNKWLAYKAKHPK